MYYRPSTITSLVFCLLFSLSLSAQHGDHGPMAPKKDTIALFTDVMGEFKREISTKNEEAQAYFTQGIQLKYAFGVSEAALSFREAQKRDPDCAICYWGEAWALGAYLNGSLSESDAPRAYEAIKQASKLAKKHASPVEKALIKAMLPRYVKDFDKETRGKQDSAYAKTMAKVYEQYPDDDDVATIYAEALFVLEPRRGARDINDPDVQLIMRVLEKVLGKAIEHPGACHLYIHATEATTQPELGEPCAEYIGNAIPGASHINHMPSHTFNEVGRWGESVRANLQASHTDQKADLLGEGVAIYPSHNLHMLLYAASFDGQGAIAIQGGRDFAKKTGNTMFHVLTLIRFGRFDEILPIKNRPDSDIAGGMWDFAQGYAHLKTGEADFAKVYLQRLLTTADTSEAKYRGHPAERLLGTLAGILEGEMHWMAHDMDKALAAFERAVEWEDAMAYDEPEPLPFAARHWQGALLLKMKQFAAAEAAYQAELDDHPNNGWSYFGLLQALKAQGKDTAEIQEKFDASWARSDIWLHASKF